ncbi:MAG: class I SAM-dependent RNA methyltransferase [Treponema sp.]|uniref:THUMP domain-containing class I SAM-dependent RNA methyltransferase n=1 Tax=Treponema sp. TaxID=166 RepID=UPI00298E71EE|nr:class I SAM-dependent RNA methyltransferase [Treponema sp.]MBR5932381.1 class I SAM-dependent RNA methyltransferase [Treponema sp.]
MNTFAALCAIGAEKILGNEIKHLGYRLLGNAPGRVIFTGDDDALYRANLCLRTSDRVYLLLARYNASDFDALFDGVYNIQWQDYYKKDVRVVVDKVRVYKSRLNSEHSIQGMVQKAIYKKLGDKWNMQTLPESGDESDVRVYIDNNEVMVLLDLSGLPLHKRGYRTDGGTAPLRETTAAAMLQMMMWRRKTPLHDPFCGSGTIAIEACLYAHNVAPGFGRRFALENLAIYNRDRALKVRRAEAENIRTDVECRITGSDIDSQAVQRAKLNAEHACVAAGRALQEIGSDAKIERPDFVQSDFAELEAPYDTGLLLCNPPYGERLGDAEEAEKLYKKMSCLFTNFPNWELGVITSHEKFQEGIGKHAVMTKDLKAGNLETKFYMYSDNLGTKKQKRK